MSHVFLTNKKGMRLIVHKDTLSEAFPTSDGKGSVCVLKVKKNKNDDSDTFTVVNDPATDIESQLRRIMAVEEAKYGLSGRKCAKCGDSGAPAGGDTKKETT